MNGAFGGNGYGTLTATAGTAIRFLVPPYTDAVARLTKVVYTAQGTAHTLTVLRPIGRTTASAAAAAGQAVINLTADPGSGANTLAANDLLAIQETDGVTRLYVVSSVSTLAVTLTANLSVGAASGAKVWNFGITTDTEPRTGLAHPAFAGTASQATTYQDSDSGIAASTYAGDPLLFNSNNATAAGTVNQISYTYTRA